METALEKKLNKVKYFFPIVKCNLPRSCYVYNSTGYTAITKELYPYETNSYELYTMVYLGIISVPHRPFPRTFSSQKVPQKFQFEKSNIHAWAQNNTA